MAGHSSPFNSSLHEMPKVKARSARYLTLRGKQGFAQEIAAARARGATWEQISGDFGISDRTARSWMATDMTTEAQCARRSASRHPPLLTCAKNDEVIRRAKAQRATQSSSIRRDKDDAECLKCEVPRRQQDNLKVGDLLAPRDLPAHARQTRPR
jgi:hypothetical protein